MQLNKIQEDIDRNLNNMIYNYRYKIRESVRLFKSEFLSEIDILKSDIGELIVQVMEYKETTYTEIEEKTAEYNIIYDDLCALTKEYE